MSGEEVVKNRHLQGSVDDLRRVLKRTENENSSIEKTVAAGEVLRPRLALWSPHVDALEAALRSARLAGRLMQAGLWQSRHTRTRASTLS